MDDQAKRISAITKQFKKDAKATRARQYALAVDMKMLRPKKRIKEVQVDHDYSGDGSPYWDYVFDESSSGGIVPNAGGEEPAANPDVLAEEDAIHRRPLTPEGERQMEVIHQTMADLTPRQRSIFRLLLDGVWIETVDEAGIVRGNRLYTQQAIADALGITQETVRDSLAGIKAKIGRRYEKLKIER